MNFWRRLRLYGFGFGIGLLVVYAMFGTRSCVSPNEQKMQELVYQHLVLSDKAKCKLNYLKRNEMLLKIELRHFEVNYDVSSIHEEPCGRYFLQAKKEFAGKYPYQLIINDCDTVSRVDDIEILTANTCTCQ